MKKLFTLTVWVVFSAAILKASSTHGPVEVLSACVFLILCACMSWDPAVVKDKK